MNAALLGALISQVGIPELERWLAGLHASGQKVDDAAVLQKLLTDTNLGEQIGNNWLAAHPAT